MKEKELVFVKIFCACCIFLFASSFCFALSFGYNVSNVSVKENYGVNELISGEFYLNLTNAPVGVFFSSDKNEDVSLVKFLDANGVSYSCKNYGCSGQYVTTNSGESTKNIQLSSVAKTYGLRFVGSAISITGFNISLSSTFPEKSEIPFSIQVGENFNWKYDLSSGNLNNLRQSAFGCFDSSATTTEVSLNDKYYCEKMDLVYAKKYFVGANISGSGLQDFTMSVRKSSAPSSTIASCEFTKTSSAYSDAYSNSGCFVNISSPAQGSYFVCIAKSDADATTTYSLKSENIGTNCGYYNSVVTPANTDYSLFALTTSYSANSGNISFDGSATSSISNYIAKYYPSGCATECIVPITFYGDAINLNVGGVLSSYSSSSGGMTSDKLYSVERKEEKINVSSFLNVDEFGWKTESEGNRSFAVYLNEGSSKEKLFNKTIYVFEKPVISSVSPMSPPAGLAVLFYANILNYVNGTSFSWSFGDNSSVLTTAVPMASHQYKEIGSYILNLTMNYGNGSESKSFALTTVSPVDYLNSTIDAKESSLLEITSEISSMPSYIQNFLKTRINLDYYQTELTNIKQNIETSYNADDYVLLAKRISALAVPNFISVDASIYSSFPYQYSEIEPSYVRQVFGTYENTTSDYKSSIYNWQRTNVDANFSRKEVSYIFDNGTKIGLATMYSVNVEPIATETYLFIQENKDLITFSTSVSARALGQTGAGIALSENQRMSLEFFIPGIKEVVIYVSPQLSELPLNLKVGACNFNGRCETGESSSNCRSDCKPIVGAILWIFFILVIMLFVYTIVQIWYKKNYEKKLFSNPADLGNLLEFIRQSKENKMSDEQIRVELLRRKWTREQVDYVVKLSRGENPLMPEIIPMEKLYSFWKKINAPKQINSQQNKVVVRQ